MAVNLYKPNVLYDTYYYIILHITTYVTTYITILLHIIIMIPLPSCTQYIK